MTQKKYKPGVCEFAFPSPQQYTPDGSTIIQYSEVGISKRTYIAIEAMKSIIAKTPFGFCQDTAKECFKIVDMMLAEEFKDHTISE